MIRPTTQATTNEEDWPKLLLRLHFKHHWIIPWPAKGKFHSNSIVGLCSTKFVLQWQGRSFKTNFRERAPNAIFMSRVITTLFPFWGANIGKTPPNLLKMMIRETQGTRQEVWFGIRSYCETRKHYWITFLQIDKIDDFRLGMRRRGKKGDLPSFPFLSLSHWVYDVTTEWFFGDSPVVRSHLLFVMLVGDSQR